MVIPITWWRVWAPGWWFHSKVTKSYHELSTEGPVLVGTLRRLMYSYVRRLLRIRAPYGVLRRAGDVVYHLRALSTPHCGALLLSTDYLVVLQY